MHVLFSTLTEVFLCFSLSCRANAKVYLAKTGHCPHSPLIVLFHVLIVFVFKCVLLPPSVNPITVKYIISLNITLSCECHGSVPFILFQYLSTSCILPTVYLDKWQTNSCRFYLAKQCCTEGLDKLMWHHKYKYISFFCSLHNIWNCHLPKEINTLPSLRPVFQQN